MLSIDSDLGRHLTLGDYILENRTVPTHDLFSHTLAGESRPPYEWLSQILFATAHHLLGLDGVILLTAVMISVTITAVFYQSVRSSHSPLIALLVTLLVAAATSLHWLPRPHIVTFLLFAIWVNLLERIQKNKAAPIFLFPLLMLLWANLHGGFIFGILALAAYIAGWLWDKWRSQAPNEIGKNYLLIALSSLGASIITPDLWRNWEAVLNNRSAFILSRTVETMPPNLTDASTAPFLVLFLLVVFFGFINKHYVSASQVLLLSGLGLIALLVTRNIPLFAIACAPFLAEWIVTKASLAPAWKVLDARFASLYVQNRTLAFPLMVVIFATILFAHRYSDNKQTYQFNSEVFPVHAANWLEENPVEGNMFNEFNWGGYLLYRSWPRDLVFVDSQSDFYGEPLLRDYETILLTRGSWRDLLHHYHIDWVIVSPQTPLAIQLKRDNQWMTVYQDPVAIILQQK